MTNQLDLLLTFEGECSRQLAGAAFQYPLEILQLLDGFDLDRLIDYRARKFIQALAARRADLVSAPDYTSQLDISAEAAGPDLPLVGLKWLIWADDGNVIGVARARLSDLQKMANAREVIQDLAAYVSSDAYYSLCEEHEPIYETPKEIRIKTHGRYYQTADAAI